MGLGEVLWARDHDSREFLELLADLAGRGLTYRQPGSGRVWVIDIDGRRQRDLDDLAWDALGRNRGVVQLWLGPDVDVLTSVEPSGSILFDLDGLTRRQGHEVAFAVVGAALRDSATRGVVVDRYLVDCQEYWEDYFSAPDTRPYDPDLLLVRLPARPAIACSLTLRADSWLASALPEQPQG